VSPRTLLVSVVLAAAACAVVYSQQPTPPPRPQPVTPTPAAPEVVPTPNIPPAGVQAVPDVPLSARSMDQLLDKLEALRAQKAAIEKQEQDLLRAIRAKQQQYNERLEKLGVSPRPVEPFAPPAETGAPPQPVQGRS
jgi:hypothetical protein